MAPRWPQDGQTWPQDGTEIAPKFRMENANLCSYAKQRKSLNRKLRQETEAKHEGFDRKLSELPESFC